jgi:hypothetical protein
MSEDTTKQLPETDSEKLTLILTGMQALTDRVESAESLRPLLHKVVDNISHLREGQIEARADILKLHEGQRALSTEIGALRRDVDHQFGNLYTKLVEIEIEHRDVHDRVTRLELNTNPPNTQT